MLGGQGGVLPNKVLRGKGVAFWGTPAQPVRQYLKQLATLARLAKEGLSVALVVIGGHSRSVGKTSVVAGLIAALPEFDWTAVKITQYGHGVCSANGEPCDCATADHSWAISEERDRSGESDTSRFLAGRGGAGVLGADRTGKLAEAMPALRQRLEGARNVIIESNSVLKFLRPDLYLTVLDPATADFKTSAREFLDRANAVILHEAPGTPAWQAVSLKPVAERPYSASRPPTVRHSRNCRFRPIEPRAEPCLGSQEARAKTEQLRTEQLLFAILARAANSFQRLAVGGAVGHSAGPHLSSSRRLRSFLVRACPADCRPAARAPRRRTRSRRVRHDFSPRRQGRRSC